MNSLQQITDAWGAWYSKNKGTSCRFTASTNYGSQKFLDDYHAYQVNAIAQSIIYDGDSLPTNGSQIAFETWFNNDMDVQNLQSLQEKKTSTRTFTWSVTESVSVGVEITVTEGVPGIASSTEKISVNLTLSSTQSETITNTQEWTVNTVINIPPKSSVKANIVIGSQSYDISFSIPVMLNGHVAIWNEKKVDGHWLWFIPITEVFADCIANNIIDTSGYSIVGGNVSALFRGVFKGSQGINVVVNTQDHPINTNNETGRIQKSESPINKIVGLVGKE